MIIKLCFIDTETTSTDHVTGGLIQLSGSIDFLDTETQQITEKEYFDYRIKPFASDIVNEEALKVNNTTKEQIASYPEPGEIHKQFTDFLGKYCDKYDKSDKMFFIGYNARFDYDFCRTWFLKNNDSYFGSWFYFPPIDVMNLAVVSLLDKRKDMTNFKLSTTASAFGLSAKGNLHDALTDIYLTKQLFLRIMQRGENDNIISNCRQKTLFEQHNTGTPAEAEKA